MSESVSLPALGESVTEGTVTRWLKNIGDRVEVDEPLLEVSTDKVDTEIPSPVAGVIEEILVQEDETVEVGAELVRIGDGSGAPSTSEPAAPAEQEPEVQAAETEPTEEATPSVDADSDAEVPRRPSPSPLRRPRRPLRWRRPRPPPRFPHPLLPLRLRSLRLPHPPRLPSPPTPTPAT